MATFINTTQPQSDTGNNFGFLFGIIVMIVFILLLFYFGLPLLRNATRSTQINVPDKVDVNVNQNPQ